MRKAILTYRLSTLLALLVIGALSFGACKKEEAKAPGPPFSGPELAGYAAMKIPADNLMTRAKVELGKQLYYDERLSGDGSRSCYSCHLAENGLTDGKPKAIGAYNAELPRSSPTLWNIGYHEHFYWDGRSGSLEAQAKAAWSGGNMGASGKDGRPSLDDICKKLDAIEGYRKQFQDVFGGPCTPDNAVKAIAAFERTIVSTEAPWMRFRSSDANALNEIARRGYEVFKGKARCINCHDGLLLTDLQYHNVGIGWDAKKKEYKDEGRFRVTQEERDKGAFKTPTLLDIAESAPYFHDGSVATLEEAVDLMLKGGFDNPNLDKANLRPAVRLTKEERADLLEFLRALSADYKVTRPTLPQ
jgi:cytochrome c peroxidase